QRAEAKLRTAEQLGWLSALDAELENFRSALAWGLEAGEDGELALRLAGSLSDFWQMRLSLSEGRGWLERALRRSTELRPGDRTRARAKVLRGAAALAYLQVDHAAALPLAEEGLAIARELGDGGLAARALGVLAGVTAFREGPAAAFPLFEEGI